MPVADAALVLSIAFLAYLVPLFLLLIPLKESIGPGRSFVIVAAIWLSTLGFVIWKSGRTNDAETRVLGLRVFHTLPVLMLAIMMVHFPSATDLNYMMGFVEVIIFGALSIYGLICLRILAMPPWPYWGYLALNMVSVWIMFSRS